MSLEKPCLLQHWIDYYVKLSLFLSVVWFWVEISLDFHLAESKRFQVYTGLLHYFINL